MRFLRFLFRRWRRADSTPIHEAEAYAHSYGDRTGEVFSVERIPEPEAEAEETPATEPEPEAEVEPAPTTESEPGPEQDSEPSPHRTSGLTDALLRRAFRAKLDARGRTPT